MRAAGAYTFTVTLRDHRRQLSDLLPLYQRDTLQAAAETTVIPGLCCPCLGYAAC